MLPTQDTAALPLELKLVHHLVQYSQNKLPRSPCDHLPKSKEFSHLVCRCRTEDLQLCKKYEHGLAGLCGLLELM